MLYKVVALFGGESFWMELNCIRITYSPLRFLQYFSVRTKPEVRAASHTDNILSVMTPLASSISSIPRGTFFMS